MGDKKEKKHKNVTGLKRLIGPPSGYLDFNLFKNLTTLNVKNAKYFYYFLHDCP
jgi:hypothetical protein